MKAWLAGITCCLAVAGCLGNEVPARSPAPQGALAPLMLSAPVNVTGLLAREPSIIQTSDGVLFVAGYQYGEYQEALDHWVPDFSQPQPLWKSVDKGKTWTRVDVGTLQDGALGNSDVDLAVAPDGTLYVAAMTFSNIGHTVAVANSRNGGSTWSWSVLSAQPFVDRPWIEVAPDGVVHVVWNDGVNVHHASSRDRGSTWKEGPLVHRGGSGMLAVSPNGDVAVRIIPSSGSGYTMWEGEDGIAISTDGGASWTFRQLPGQRAYSSVSTGDGDGIPRWADPLGFDSAGMLYAPWGERDVLLLARSPDLATSWKVAETSRVRDGYAFYPHLRAGPEAGNLAVTWFTSEGGGLPFAHVAHVHNADSAAPVVQEASFQLTTWNTGGEYFQAIFLKDGGIGFAFTIQSETVGFAYRTAV